MEKFIYVCDYTVPYDEKNGHIVHSCHCKIVKRKVTIDTMVGLKDVMVDVAIYGDKLYRVYGYNTINVHNLWEDEKKELEKVSTRSHSVKWYTVMNGNTTDSEVIEASKQL